MDALLVVLYGIGILAGLWQLTLFGFAIKVAGQAKVTVSIIPGLIAIAAIAGAVYLQG